MFTGWDVLAIGIVSIATVVVLGKDIAVGGPRHGDSAVHAMDGVLIHDWVAAGPRAWVSPVHFAEQQYAHYPALGIGRHYPPGFAVVEAGFFAIFGISVFTARMCVVFFGLLAAVGTHTFMRSLSDRGTSALTAVILITLPAVTLWGRQTMLEIPTLAVLSWGAVSFARYLRGPSWTRLFILLGVALFAIAFRQTGVFLLGAVTVTLTLCALRRTVRPSHWFCTAAVAAVAVPLVLFSLGGNAAQMLRGYKTFPDLWSFEALTYYVRQIPEQVGLIILLLAVIGLVASHRRAASVFQRFHDHLSRRLQPARVREGTQRSLEFVASRGLKPAAPVGTIVAPLMKCGTTVVWVFLGSWVLLCYVMLTAADCKTPRLFFVALFPFSVWAGLGARSLLGWIPSQQVRVAAMGLAGVACCTAALMAPVAHRPDYGAVIMASRSRIERGPVLFSGVRDGDFVFALRQHIPWRKAMVIRGSKLLYTCTAYPSLDFVSHVSSAEELAGLMDQLAFEYVFVERANELVLTEDALLRTYLAESGAYRRIAAYPLQPESAPTHRDVTIDVYEAVEPRARTVDHFDIPIPRDRRTIRADLTGWSDS